MDDHTQKEPTPGQEVLLENSSPENKSAQQENTGQFSPPPIFNEAGDYSASHYYTPAVPRESRESFIKATALIKEPSSLVMLIFIWIFGIFFCETFLRSGFGFGLSVPMCSAIFFGTAAFYLKPKGEMLSGSTIILLTVVGLISASFFFTQGSLTYTVNVFLLIFLFLITLAKLAGFRAKTFSKSMIVQSLSAGFASMFSFLDMPFRALGGLFKKDGKSAAAKPAKIILGVILSLPVAVIFISLFTSADNVFDKYVTKVIDAIGLDFGYIVFDIVMGSIIFIFASACLISIKSYVAPDTEEKQMKGFLDSTVFGTVLFVVALIHVLFIAVQSYYLYGGEAYFRKEGFAYSYSEYATKGFFELCASSLLLFALILFIYAFMKRKENSDVPIFTKVTISILVVCNLNIFASVLYRMYMYIDAYDLSVKRLALVWLILLTGISSLGIVVKFFVPKLRLFNYISVVTVIMVLILNAANINYLVADYNTKHYFEKTAGRYFDVYYISSLGPSATPSLVELYLNESEKKPSAEVKEQIKYELNRHNSILSTTKTWRNIDLPSINARKALTKAGFKALSSDGYDENGYDAYGYDRYGFNKDGFDSKGNIGGGYDADGYDDLGYDQNGYDRDGYDRDGYDGAGYDRNGRNRYSSEYNSKHDYNGSYQGSSSVTSYSPSSNDFRY